MKKITFPGKTFGMMVFTLLIFVFPTIIFAQGPQSRLWTVPPKQIKFPTLSTPPLPTLNADYTGQQSAFTNNAMHDPNGNLLFFIVDGSVYDRNGLLIGPIINPTYTNLTVTGATEWEIIPVPGHCTQYYLVGGCYIGPGISPGFAGGIPLPYYVTLDLSLAGNSGYGNSLAMGDFIGGNNAIFLDDGISGGSIITPNDVKSSDLHFAVTPLRSNGERFLYINYRIGSLISRFKVTSSGIIFGSYNFQAQVDALLSGEVRAEMELVQLGTGNYRIAVPYVQSPSTNTIIFVADCDAITGDIIPNTVKKIIPNPGVCDLKGLEFSANGKYLYITHTNAPYLEYSDVTMLAPTFNSLQAIPSIAATLLSPQDFKYSQIEMGNDGNIYFPAGNRIASLNINFNNSPVGATWTDNAIPSITVPTSVGLGNAFFSSADFTKILLMNEQIDGDVYQTYNTSSGADGCCIFNTVFAADNYTAGTSIPGITPNTFNYTATTQTWTPTNNPFGGASLNPVSTVTIKNKLVIPPGFNITVTGMTFKFAPRTFSPTPTVVGAHVEVQRSASSTSGTGGRLILGTGTDFTSYDACGKGMWEGIWVQGYGNGFSVSQQNILISKMGWLIVKNGAIVENAYRGAVTAQLTNPLVAPPSLPGYVNGTEGGVIIGNSQAWFRNNEISVQFFNYDYPSSSIDNNVSYFSQCKFQTTLALNDPNLANPFSQVYLWNVKGISFYGNNFFTDEVNSPYTAPAQNSGIGIYSINSYFSVTPLTFPFTKNVFQNLWYGIAAADIFSTKTIFVSQSDFKHNYNGIATSGINREVIIQNNFEVLRTPTFIFPVAYGLYISYGRGFQVEENDFKYSGATSPSASSWGIVVNQSNPLRNCGLYDEIYRNTFHSILVGCQAQGNNSEQAGGGSGTCYPNSSPTTPNNIGLVFKCNTFFNNIDAYNIRVVDFNSVKGNIGFQQGVCQLVTSGANNKFSHTCTNAAGDYAIQSTSSAQNPTAIDYSYYSNVLTLKPANNCYTPFVTSPFPAGVSLTECVPSNNPTYNDANSCPSNLGPVCLSCTKLSIASFQRQADSANSILANGNSASLYAIIASHSSPGQIKNTLSAPGPYLSDGVLLALINRTPQLPPGILKDIILNNSPLSPNVLAAFDHLSLPNGIKQQVDNSQTGTSARSTLESFLSYATGQHTFQVDKLLRFYLTDSATVGGADSVIRILKIYNIPEGKCDLAKAFFDVHDTANARVTLTAVQQAGGADKFCLLAGVLLQLGGNITNICFSLPGNPGATGIVQQVAADTLSRECVNAQALLTVAYGLFLPEYVVPLFNPQQNQRIMANTPAPIQKLVGKIYPNPNDGTMQLVYSLQDGEKGTLEIFDIMGKRISNYALPPSDNGNFQINEGELNQGIYFYRYSVNGQVVNSEKLVIMK